MAEEKEISKMSFNISDALKQLNTLSDKIDSLSKKSSESINIKLSNSNVQKVEVTRQKEAIKTANIIERQNAKVANSTKSLYDKVAGYAKTYLIYNGFNELRQAAQEVVEEMVNVESQMVQIDRVLNDGSLNITKYRDELIQLAYDYGNPFENVADITLRLAQAGFDAQQSIKLTESTLLALNTAELDATEATDDMVAVMSQWNLMEGDATEVAKEYSNIIDKINRTADNFPTTSADILDALKKTSSAFNLAGASIDETIASIVAAEKASQRGGKAIGTALNNIVSQLKDDKKIDIAKSLGISFFTDETESEFKDIMDIFSELSAKMEELKSQGKESSVEMQTLLEVFTLFRRNIGSSLLGEMGEGGTYDQVMELLDLEDTIGYSINENAKYMKTAEAAQQQFNATLLELKTTVWDGGVEDVFRGMLVLGNDLTEALNTLVDSIGSIPTAAGVATLAFSGMFKGTNAKNLLEVKEAIQLFNDETKEALKMNQQYQQVLNNSKNGFATYINSVSTGSASLKGYEKSLLAAKAQTIALTAKTILLQAAISLGITVAITTLITVIDKLVHAEENRRKKAQENLDETQEEIEKIQEQRNEIQSLIKEYENLDNINIEEKSEKELELNKDINKILKEHGITIDETNNSLETKLQLLKDIERQELRNEIVSKREEIRQKENLIPEHIGALENTGGFETYLREQDLSIGKFNKMSFGEQKKQLEEYVETHKQYGESVQWAREKLQEFEKSESDVISLQEDLNELLAQDVVSSYVDDIHSVEDYKAALDALNELELMPGFTGTLEEQREYFKYYLSNALSEYAEKVNNTNSSVANFTSALNSNLSTLDSLNSKYTEVTSAVNEFNQYGQLSSATFQSLINNDLLEYLDFSNGKLKANTQSLLDQAEATKVSAIESLQDAASKDIQNLALGKTESLSATAQAAIAKFGDSASTSGKQSITAAQAINTLAVSIDNTIKAQKGELAKGVDTATFTKQANAIASAYKNIANNIGKMNIASASYKPAQAASNAAKSAKDAAKSVEDSIKDAVSAFKKGLEDIESAEQSWVNKYKKLDLFSTSDLKFITHQRINRYNEYLNQIQQLQGISEEDRLELTREYSAKRQEAELEYFDLLKDQLDNQISELKKANEERIKGIEETAQAQIDALQKVEDENDRIREKEEYERKRQELLYGYEGIEYWSQRTGRDAQLALAEAQKELEELDRDWNEKKEEWTLEEQIEEIEKARDAQIKAVEDAQEIQIKAWQDAYQAQVDLYAQTGQIIYDGSIINAGYLYNAYMDNFVTPLNSKIQDLINGFNQATQVAVQTAVAAEAAQRASVAAAQAAANEANAKAQAAQNNSNNRKWLYQQTFNTMQVPQQSKTQTILQANAASSSTHSISSRNLYSDLRKKIGKFHGGGMVGGSNEEALALLRKNEVVLTPEWAAGMNKLVDRINKNENIVNNNNPTHIEVEGNLVNFDAKINSRQDMEETGKIVEKVLRDKFNIKK